MRVCLLVAALIVASSALSNFCYVDERAIPGLPGYGSVLFSSIVEATANKACENIYARVARVEPGCIIDDRATPDTEGYGVKVFPSVAAALAQDSCHEFYVRINLLGDYFEQELKISSF